MKAMWLMLAVVLLWLSKAQGAELSEDTARRLISEAVEIPEAGIRIASLIEGSKKLDDGFEARTAMRVTSVHPVLGERGMRREVRCYTFQYSPQYGWFHQEIREARGGQEVWIWSETRGKVIVK